MFPSDLRWLYLDMNSFFASVEQEVNPALRGKPIAVAPVLAESGACVAASYPAKRMGVKTGMRVAEARRICPGIIILPANMPRYVEHHHRVIAAVERVTHVDGVRSIDELAIRLDPSEREPEAARTLGLKIKAALREHAGVALTASIGIASNEFLAKIAADMKKPDGLTLLPRFAGDAPPREILALKLQDFPGISTRMEARLNARGITTVAEMYAVDRKQLHAVWNGVLGDRWHDLIRGEEVPRPVTRTRTIGHSHVLPPKLRNESGVRAVLLRLLQKAAARLRAKGCRTGALQIYVKGVRSWGAEARFDPVSDPLSLAEQLQGLWAQRDFAGPVATGLVLHDLVTTESYTPSLFSGPNRRSELGPALDAISARFGKNAVYLASSESAKETAEEKIAFVKTELFDEGKGVDEKMQKRAAELRAKRKGRAKT